MALLLFGRDGRDRLGFNENLAMPLSAPKLNRCGRDALHSRRLHVQFNIVKRSPLEWARVAPVALERASAGRSLIGAGAGKDLIFADDMAAAIGSREGGGIVRHDGAVPKIINAMSRG